jgi:hypothetical protein
MKSKYHNKMNKLAMRMSSILHGEDLLDVATVCARIVAFAINAAYEDDSEKIAAADRLIAFIRTDLTSMMQEEESSEENMSRH